jgi:sugar phosphate isomerase/epimerase
MAMEFGVSTSICLGEVRKLIAGDASLSEKDAVSVYLGLLDDFTRFALEDSFDMIEIEPGFSIISASRLFQVAGELKRMISPFRTVSCHLPLADVNISALHPDIRRQSIEETKSCIDLCQELGIAKLVMHPGCFAGAHDRYTLLANQVRTIAQGSVDEIATYCDERNMELSLENLNSSEPLFKTPEEFEPFISKGIGITLDTAHAVVSGQNPLDFITKFGRQITEVHLSSAIESESSSHYPLGTGTVDYAAVLQKLGEMDYDGRIILEVESKEALIESKRLLKVKGYL